MLTKFQKVQQEIIKNNRTYKLVYTQHTIPVGNLIDTFQDNEGHVIFQIRKAPTIIPPYNTSEHNRSTGEGNMISFSINFSFILRDFFTDYSESWFDRCVRKCEYSLEKAYKYFVKENLETADERYTASITQKIMENLEEYPASLPAINALLNCQRVQNNLAFKNALQEARKTLESEESDTKSL